MSNHIERDVINALMTGNLTDPFTILGMHETAEGLEVRALLPEATQAWVLDHTTGRQIDELMCLDARGFFCAILSRFKDPFRYQFEVVWNGQRRVIDDPYRFGHFLQKEDARDLKESTMLRSYQKLGAHADKLDGVEGVRFSVWAENARRVSIVGHFNDWDGRRHPMRLCKKNGVWSLFVPEAKRGQGYKFEIVDALGHLRTKVDPYALEMQMFPEATSLVCKLPEKIKPNAARRKANQFDSPLSIYEVHLGSWRRHPENNAWFDYQELTKKLIPYVKEMGFTHIELLPINEHPFDGSWGYQPVGFYAPTRRFGTSDDFKAFIEAAHNAGLNVVLDWVPGHFPCDDFGLARFDGTELYEYSDPREGFHPDWNTLIFNYNRKEIRDYLVGNALYWIEHFGIDALRVDAVTSMIYRDFSREAGEWIPNALGGRENLEAIALLRDLNRTIDEQTPGVVTMAEESSDFPGVSRSPSVGGLGFGYKWNMGWMHDTLNYMKSEPSDRKHHHDKMTFGMAYHYDENFVLPLSHDEVVHCKGSLIDRMPGNLVQKLANLRAYYGWMWAFPGKKLLFMGNEFAQLREWDHDGSLDWHLMKGEENGHKGMQRLVRDLNFTYRRYKALYELDFDPRGFEWLVADDKKNSVFVFVRRDSSGREIIVASNFLPVTQANYRFGVNQQGCWRAVLNTDSICYQGTGLGSHTAIPTEHKPSHGREHSLCVRLPPFSTLWFAREEA